MLAFGQASPQFFCEKNSFDFGKIEKGEKVTAHFKFTNKGDAPLEIINVETSCGCTSAKPAKNTYAPGESGELDVHFDSGRFSNQVTKRVTVVTNDPKKPKTILTISADIQVDVNLKPSSLFFARAKLGATETVEVKISTKKLPKLEISELNTNADYLAAELVRVDDKNLTLKISALGEKFPKDKPRLNTLITFKSNNKAQEKMSIPVTVVIQKALDTMPKSVYFFASKQGTKYEKTFRIISNDGRPFQLKEVKADKDFMTAEVVEDNGKMKVIKVTLKENAPEGKFSGRVDITTNLTEQPTMFLPFRGSVVK